MYEWQAAKRAERDKLPENKCVIAGGGWNGGRYSPGDVVTLADLRRAIAAHGDNQTRFAREVMGCKDGRQVRRWLAREYMGDEHAARLRQFLATLATGKRAKGKRAK